MKPNADKGGLKPNADILGRPEGGRVCKFCERLRILLSAIGFVLLATAPMA